MSHEHDPFSEFLDSGESAYPCETVHPHVSQALQEVWSEDYPEPPALQQRAAMCVTTDAMNHYIIEPGRAFVLPNGVQFMTLETLQEVLPKILWSFSEAWPKIREKFNGDQ